MDTSTGAGTAAPASPTPAEPTAPPGVVGQSAPTLYCIEGARNTWVYVKAQGARVSLHTHWSCGYITMDLLPQDARDLASDLVAHANFAGGVM